MYQNIQSSERITFYYQPTAEIFNIIHTCETLTVQTKPAYQLKLLKDFLNTKLKS